jgi:O-succinylbenzoate synthase
LSTRVPIRLAAVDLREIRLPLREPFRISSGEMRERRILLLELVDADGDRVWSECVAGEVPNYSPETVDTAWLAITRWLAPRLLGREFAAPPAVDEALGKNVRGHLMARAALEMGCWGLVAEKAAVSLSQLLGGTRTEIATGISIGIQRDPATLVEKAAAALAAGYRKIKVKIQPGADVEFVGAVREALGEEAPLMADANNAYTLDDAEHLARLDDFRLVMIEQPLGWDDVVRHGELQRRLRTPICLDESITGLDKVEDMLRLGAGRIVNIKAGRVGGFTSSRAIEDLCRRSGVPVWCGGMLESGVGRAYNVALASLPGFTIPGDVSPSARYWERDVVAPEWTMSDGMVTVPAVQGLGVTVDVDRIDDLTTRRETLTA